jgi:AbrB family looped-hinge helix DNA binding protein
MERLKLKISPKGQITLPKKVREQLFTGDYVYLNLKKDRAILEPVSFIDEFEDLILRDVQKEGHAAEEEAEEVKKRKLNLLKALREELYESVEEAERGWKEGNAVVLWPEKE